MEVMATCRMIPTGSFQAGGVGAFSSCPPPVAPRRRPTTMTCNQQDEDLITCPIILPNKQISNTSPSQHLSHHRWTSTTILGSVKIIEMTACIILRNLTLQEIWVSNRICIHLNQASEYLSEREADDCVGLSSTSSSFHRGFVFEVEVFWFLIYYYFPPLQAMTRSSNGR
jgi:hypothetical protein